VASLHDDDWWAPEHLERALQALRAKPNCVAVYSSFFTMPGPEYPPAIPVPASWCIWIAAGSTFAAPILNLTPESVFLATLINVAGAPFHYSTMVGEAGAVWEAYCGIVETGNEFDNDRTFPVFLASRGTVAFLTAPDVYVRVHPGQDCRSSKYSAGKHRKYVRRTLEWMRARWPAEFAAAIERFNSAMAGLDPASQAAVEGSVNYRQLAEFGLTLPPRSLRWYVKQMTPPAIAVLYNRLWRGH
jgi:hypothetical protein